METNDLKSIWKKHTNEKIERDLLSEEELNRMRYSKSKSMIRKIKNGIVFELTFTALMVMVISYFLRMELHIVIEIAIVIMDLAFLFLLGVYFQYLRTVQQHKIETINLRENLKKLIEEIERVLNFLFIISVILIPIGGLFGYIVGFFIGAEKEAEEVFKSTTNLIILPTVIAIITLIGFPLTKWYLNFMYGRHVKKLKETLNELIQEEN